MRTTCRAHGVEQHARPREVDALDLSVRRARGEVDDVFDALERSGRQRLSQRRSAEVATDCLDAIGEYGIGTSHERAHLVSGGDQSRQEFASEASRAAGDQNVRHG